MGRRVVKFSQGLTLSIGGPKSFEFSRLDVGIEYHLDENDDETDDEVMARAVAFVEKHLSQQAAEATGEPEIASKSPKKPTQKKGPTRK
jgi:hypothetical protein